MWAKLRSTRGVIRVVSFANKPAAIADEVIDHIKASMDKVAEQGGIKPGQAVELDDGPFQGIGAIFQAYDGEERAIVLITFMQKQQRVSVPVSAIRTGWRWVLACIGSLTRGVRPLCSLLVGQVRKQGV